MSEDSRWETPTSKRPWIFILALFAAWLFTIYSFAADAAEPPLPESGPDYITTTGIRVYDPFHHSFAEEVDVWALMTFMKAPEEDRGALFEIFDGMTLIIHEGPKIEGEVYPCGAAPEGKILLGCTDPFSKTINIAWRPCLLVHPSAGVFSHEIGHLATFFLRGVLGHADEQWFGPTQDRMANRVSEPICRMGK